MDGRDWNGWNRLGIFLTILLVTGTLVPKCQLNAPRLLVWGHCAAKKIIINKILSRFCKCVQIVKLVFVKTLFVSYKGQLLVHHLTLLADWTALLVTVKFTIRSRWVPELWIHRRRMHYFYILLKYVHFHCFYFFHYPWNSYLQAYAYLTSMINP